MDRTQLLNTARTNMADLSRGNLGVPLLLLVMLAMMMLPVPPFLLDVFFTFNIALSIVVLLVCVYALRPLDFAVFPTILLVATLLRLALNVASTRVVMLHGQDGHAAAGKATCPCPPRRECRTANSRHVSALVRLGGYELAAALASLSAWARAWMASSIAS